MALRDSNPPPLPCKRRPARSPDLGKQAEMASQQVKRVLNVSHHFSLFLNLSRPKRGPRMRTGLNRRLTPYVCDPRVCREVEPPKPGSGSAQPFMAKVRGLGPSSIGEYDGLFARGAATGLYSHVPRACRRPWARRVPPGHRWIDGWHGAPSTRCERTSAAAAWEHWKILKGATGPSPPPFLIGAC